jgi:WD40 repeat protein
MNGSNIKRSTVLILIILISNLILSACGAAGSPPDMDSSTGNGTLTPAPSVTPSPTLSYPVSIGTPVHSTFSELNPQNISSLVDIAKWGLGETLKLEVKNDGKRLIAYFSGGIVVYNLDTFEQVTIIKHDLDEYSTTYDSSPDGEYLAVSDTVENLHQYTTTIQIWSATTGLVVHTLQADDLRCGEKSIFSPDNHMLAFDTSCNEGFGNRVILWKLNSYNDSGIQVLNESDGWEAAFSPKGDYFAVGYDDGKIKFWHVEPSGTLSGTSSLTTGATGNYLQITFLPDGKQLVGMYDYTTYFWSIPDGELLYSFYGAGCKDYQYPGLSKPLPAANLFLRGGCQYSNVWDLSNQATIYSSTNRYYPDVSADGSHMIVQTENNYQYYLELYELPVVKLIATWKTSPVWHFFTADGMYIVDSSDRVTRLYASADGSLVYEFAGNMPVEVASTHQLVTIGMGKLMFWSLQDGSQVREIPFPNSGKKVSFSPDGKKLIETFAQGVRLVDLETLTSTTIETPYVAISLNGNRAVYQIDEGYEVRDLPGGQVVNIFQIYQPGAGWLSPDGSILVTAREKEFSVWQVDEEKKLFSFSSPHWIHDLEITPDNRFLLINWYGPSLDTYTELSIWETPQGNSVWRQRTQAVNQSTDVGTRRNCTYSFALSPDGHHVAFTQLNDTKDGCKVSILDLTSMSILSEIDLGTDWKDFYDNVSMALSNGGVILTTTFQSGEIKFWNGLNGTLLKTLLPTQAGELDGFQKPGDYQAFSPDNRFMAVIQDGAVILKGIPSSGISFSGFSNIPDSAIPPVKRIIREEKFDQLPSFFTLDEPYSLSNGVLSLESGRLWSTFAVARNYGYLIKFRVDPDTEALVTIEEGPYDDPSYRAIWFESWGFVQVWVGKVGTEYPLNIQLKPGSWYSLALWLEEDNINGVVWDENDSSFEKSFSFPLGNEFSTGFFHYTAIVLNSGRMDIDEFQQVEFVK